MDDHEVPVGNANARLIFQRRGDALDQIEETIAAGLDMGAVLDVVGGPVALSRHIVSLVEEGIEGLEDKCFIARFDGIIHCRYPSSRVFDAPSTEIQLAPVTQRAASEARNVATS